MRLAADVGGTHIRMGLFDGKKQVRFVQMESKAFSSLEEAIETFLGKDRCKQMVIAIAGPVIEGTVATPNLPWVVSESVLERSFCTKVRLINDLVANLHGALHSDLKDRYVLQEGKGGSCAAIISAGTGLGAAFGNGASEFGHTDFAPRSDREIELYHFLRQRYGHVSVERILSGEGIVQLYSFTSQKASTAPEITLAARSKSCPGAVEALELFCSIYGATAGNFALTTLAQTLYIGGGIAPKILLELQRSKFVEAFCDKGRFTPYLQKVRIEVLLDELTTLKGALFL